MTPTPNEKTLPTMRISIPTTLGRNTEVTTRRFGAMAKKRKKSKPIPNPQAHLLAYQRWHKYEALWSRRHGKIVRFIEFNGKGKAVVGSELGCHPFPDALELEELERPSSMESATWHREFIDGKFTGVLRSAPKK
jgi:hypothetical protein